MGKFVENAYYIVEVEFQAGRYQQKVRQFKNVQQLENVGRMLTKKGKRRVRIYQQNGRKNFWVFGRC